MVPVSNLAFALQPLIVIYALRAPFLFPEGPMWLEVLVTLIESSVSSSVW